MADGDTDTTGDIDLDQVIDARIEAALEKHINDYHADDGDSTGGWGVGAFGAGSFGTTA